MIRHYILSGLACVMLLSNAALAESANETKPVLRVAGKTLYYDTENLPSELAEVSDDHVDPFLNILRKHTGLQKLELNSSGGSVWAANQIARYVVDYGLDTNVTDECSSACVRIFLAGRNRTMDIGAQIGFHQKFWDPEDIEDYYERWKEDENWNSVFEFAEWIYEDTQTEIYQDLAYYLSRDVSAEFAIESIRPPTDGMWYPSRKKLEDSGVLRRLR